MTQKMHGEICERIYKLIGSPNELNARIANMELSDKIKARNQYDKMKDKLFKIAEQGGEKALAVTMIREGNISLGITAQGKQFMWVGNTGYTARSWHCGTLTIEEQGTIFTSGSVAKALEYILNN